MYDPEPDFSRVKGMSLERKLPLLMTGVLLALLAGGVLFSYREVRRASEVLSAGRLRDFTDGLAGSTTVSIPRLAAQFREVAREPVVRRALTSKRLSGAELANVKTNLRKLSTPADSGIVTELRSADGRVIASVGETANEDSRPPTAAVVTGPDSLAIGSFYESGGRVYYWNTRAVVAESGRIGTIAQRRRLNSQTNTEREIVRLAGQDVRVVFRNSDGSFWTTLSGRPISAPVDRRVVRGMLTFAHPEVVSTGRVVAYEKAVERTPWTVMLELPYAALGEGPRQILRRFALMSLVLLVVGALALWLISRRITSPLARLTSAAEAIAKGDYSQRVDPRGDYEIARLGTSFNRMASEIAAANDKLHATAGAAAEAKEAAEAANTSKSNFLAAMSHELRTPLNAIAGYVDLMELELRGPLTEQQRNDLTRIKRSQKYLLGLIEEVLVFSQIDAQQLAFTIEDVSIDAIIRDAEAMVDQQISAKGIAYHYDVCDPSLLVHADRDKTQQVLINLLVNATKYTDPGGSITVSCERSAVKAHIHVTDTGVGIPREKLGRIFEAFVQLDRSLNQPREGVGLGLTISRDLARAMGGDLHVESTVGKGSTFTLDLPLAALSPASAPRGIGTFERETVASH
jgi:signal transduction histidine kinase